MSPLKDVTDTDITDKHKATHKGEVKQEKEYGAQSP